MTINTIASYPTESLVRDRKPNLFKTRIPSQHYQLKNFISTRHDDVLYYAADYEIYSLHLPTSKRRLVKSLRWKPSCLDAAYDWICVGGQSKGQCAFIEIGRRNSGSSLSSPSSSSLPSLQHAEVDDLLTLDLNPESRELIHQRSPTLRLPLFQSPTYTTHEYNFGDRIVNSVVVQRLPGGQEGLEDQIVVVLCNNDGFVRIFSLSKLEMLASPPEYPTAMNHATISPCGNVLLAVGDEPHAYFSQRRFTKYARKGKACWEWEWEWYPICEPKLSLALKEDYCFSTAFSPSGHICAAASQTGIITLFDVHLIRDDVSGYDAVVATSRSSRPNVSNLRGAIRSMSFSPSPFDLLVVAEDQGRVQVIDLRNALQSSQILCLEPELPKVNGLEIVDHESLLEQRQLEIQRRFFESHSEAQAAQDHLAAVTSTADLMEYVAERRRRERENLNDELAPLRSDPHRLTESERQMLDTVGQRRSQPFSIDSFTPLSTNHPSSSNRYLSHNPAWEASSSSNNPSRYMASIAEYMRLRNIERPRHANERSLQPRRRSSVVITGSNMNTNSSPNPSSLAPLNTGTSALSTSPARLPSASVTDLPSTSIDEPWQTISHAMNANTDTLARLRSMDTTATSVRGLQFTPSANQRNPHQPSRSIQQYASRSERQRQAALSNAQRLSTGQGRLTNLDSEEEEPVTVGDLIGRADAGDGVTTMGVGWSPDGRKLYVATEVGIFEYEVNTVLRRQFPGMSWV